MEKRRKDDPRDAYTCSSSLPFRAYRTGSKGLLPLQGIGTRRVEPSFLVFELQCNDVPCSFPITLRDLVKRPVKLTKGRFS